tara:strand:- start:2378 stop:2896 length:519 start_codon:yes stop_codon:yes gene_type:complete
MTNEKNNSFQVICLTGTPGTGKSTWAKVLEKKLRLYRLDLQEYYKIVSVTYNYSKQCYDVDLKKFVRLVKEKILWSKKEKYLGLVIDTHISHKLPPKLIDLCVVLICSDLKKLEKRLIKRKYSQKKIRENLDTEIFQVCLTEAQEQGHKIVSFDTSKKILQKEFLTKTTKSL